MSAIRIVWQNSYVLDAGDEILNPSRPADLEKIVEHLSSPHVVAALGLHGKAEAIIEMLKVMKPEQQAAVLSTPDAIWGLTRGGLAGGQAAAAVIKLLKAMAPAAQQARVLSAPNAIWILAAKGHAAAVIEFLKALSPEHQAAILSAPNAVESLADNGQGAAVEDIRRSLAPQLPSGVPNSAKSCFENRL